MNAKLLRGKRGMAVRGMIRTLLVLFSMLPMWAFALGLGDIKLHSALEEPFDAEIELTSATKSVLKSLQVKLAPKEDFARVGIKPVAAIKLLRFEVVQKPGGGAAIHVTTSEPIHDPYLNFLVEASWGRGRVLREYTVLLDPPELAGEETPIIEAPTTAVAEPEPAMQAPAVEPPPVSPAVSAPEVAAPELPAVEGEELIGGEQTQVAEPEVIEPEPLPPLDDEALIDETMPAAGEGEAEAEQMQVAEPEVIEPEPLPALDDEALIDETTSAAEESAAEPEPAAAAGEESAQPATAAVEPEEAPKEETFPEVGEVTVAAEPAEESAPLSYTVKRGDTLWSIAQRIRGDRSVSVYQVMMALFYNNPNAFFKENVNNLKAGSVLRIEDEGELSAISTATAKNEFWQQYRAWQEYKQMLAKNVVTQAEAPESAPGEIVSEKTYTAEEVAELPEATRATQEEGAQLKLVSPDEVEPEAPKHEAVADTGKETAEPSEEKPATSASLDELQAMREKVLAEIESSEAGTAQNQALREKLAALEEQIASLQRVVSVKDTELAALQQKTAEEITQPAAGIADEPTKPAEEGLIAMLNRSPQLMGVMGGIILLLLAWLWLMLRNRRIERDEETAVAVAGAGGAASLEEEAPQVVAEKAEDGVLSQVDAYVKQGKHAAAVETLTEALEREPDNEEYRYRLLELHYEMKNKEGFRQEAEELYSRTGGLDRARWGKVAAMGAALLPTHALFAEGAVAEESGITEEGESPVGEKESPAAGGEWDDLESELEEAAGQREGEAYEFEADVDDDGMVEALLEDDGQSLPDEAEPSKSSDDWEQAFELEQTEEDSDSYLLEEDILEEKGAAEGFDDGIEFTLNEDVGAAGGAVEAAEESASDVGGEVLEFTRREEDLPAEPESASVVSPETETEAEAVGAESPEAEAVEFESAEVEVGEEPSAEQPDGDLDLEFDVEKKEEVEDTSATELAEDLLDEEEEDLLALDEDEELSFPNLSEYDSMAEDSELLDDVDEIGTKLDLARAYIDMGDKEAARSMLDEVKQEGDQAQKEEADELLAQLGG